MAGYQRKTALPPSQVFERADDLIPEMIGLTRTKASGHSATFTGEEGTVTVTAHRHGPYTDVVASTDGLRTSRIDYEIQKFLNQLPYEPGDRAGNRVGGPPR